MNEWTLEKDKKKLIELNGLSEEDCITILSRIAPIARALKSRGFTIEQVANSARFGIADALRKHDLSDRYWSKKVFKI